MNKLLIEGRSLLLLAFPVIIAQISQTAMGVVDTIMAGGYSATDMAAVAVGTSIWLPAILLGHGLLLALIPIVAQLDGARKRNEIAPQIQQAFWLAAAVSVLIIVVFYNSRLIIDRLDNVDPILAKKAVGYLHAMMWGVPGYLFFQVLQGQCEGVSKTKPGMVIGFMGLLANIPINYIFIYGKFGIPAMGGVGCGIATAIIDWVMFSLLYLYVRQAPSLRDIKLQHCFARPDKVVLLRLFLLGLPIALSMFFEVTLFAVVALLVSPLGVVAVAGHQIALNFSTLMFVLPMSLGVAATIRIGYRIGEGSVEEAQTASYAALGLGITLAICTAIFTIVLRRPIALLYSDNPEVITMATQLMLLAAIFQISDAIQSVGNGVLRGYKDTRSIFFITFTAYWIVGLPSGYLLALTDIIVPAMGPQGFWIGFILGLTAAALMMLYRIFSLQRQPSELILQYVTCK